MLDAWLAPGVTIKVKCLNAKHYLLKYRLNHVLCKVKHYCKTYTALGVLTYIFIKITSVSGKL